MVHPYLINTLNGLVLMLLGLGYYFAPPSQDITTLIIPAFGLLLLACTHHLRRHNRFVFHTVTSLTLLAAILLIIQLRIGAAGWSMKDYLLLLMSISCFIASAFYVGTFVQERRRGGRVYKDDL
ncbi:hypothetical protein [Pontibacter chitinilyticus]|uniref:hypothetical protein n=1 Tax=Pontibacter chitinilyticus TaxID=2674989 RepID=UPI00321C272C